AGTTRLHRGGSLAAVKLLETFNSWNAGLDVGDSTEPVELRIQAGDGDDADLLWRQNAVTRARGRLTANGMFWLLSVFDTNGSLIDSPINLGLGSGSTLPLGGSGRALANNGVVRATTDNTRDLGTQAFRWKTIFSLGGF